MRRWWSRDLKGAGGQPVAPERHVILRAVDEVDVSKLTRVLDQDFTFDEPVTRPVEVGRKRPRVLTSPEHRQELVSVEAPHGSLPPLGMTNPLDMRAATNSRPC